MSRTTRAYNKPNKSIGIWCGMFGWQPYWHPYRVLCMGHCKCCREDRVSKWRRLKYKQELREAIKHEI